MKYFKRLGLYKAANVTFNPKSLDAHSYGWWRFVALVDGLVVFNNFSYSNTTAKHQRKVSGLLNELGIKVDLTLSLPSGINSTDLSELIVRGEEQLCHEFLQDEEKKIRRNEQAKARKEKQFEQAMEWIAKKAQAEGLGVVDLDGKTAVRIDGDAQ